MLRTVFVSQLLILVAAHLRAEEPRLLEELEPLNAVHPTEQMLRDGKFGELTPRQAAEAIYDCLVTPKCDADEYRTCNVGKYERKCAAIIAQGKEATPVILRVLRLEDREMREDMSRMLQFTTVFDSEIQVELCSWIRSDPSLSTHAIETLRVYNHPNEQVRAALLAFVMDPPFQARVQQAFPERGRPARILSDNEYDSALNAAAWSLGLYGPKILVDIDPLLESEHQAQKMLASRALESLARTHPPEVIKLFSAPNYSKAELAVYALSFSARVDPKTGETSAAVESLCEVIRLNKEPAARRAMRAVSRAIAAEEVKKLFMQVAVDEHYADATRMEAVRQVSRAGVELRLRAGDLKIVPVLTRVLGGDDESDAAAAADLLGNCGPFARSAIPKLEVAAYSRKPILKSSAEQALRKLEKLR